MIGRRPVTVTQPEIRKDRAGYPVQELCRRCSFEEVAYLLWHGELPAREQLSAQNRSERSQRALDPGIAATLASQPLAAHPMDILQTAVSLLGANDPAASDISHTAIHAKTLRLFAVLPAVVAMDQRRRHGLGAVAPRDDLSYAANFLYMTFGKIPEPQIVAAFETSLILYAERSFDASAFTECTLSDLYSAVTAAIGALREPLRGGASAAVLEMIDEIGIPDNVQPWLDEALVSEREITGFGHRVYKDGDPRVPAMRTALGMIAALRGDRHLLEIYDTLAAAVYQATGLRPNLDYPAGPAYNLIGFDTPTFSPIVAAARLPGWTAYIAGRLAGKSLIGSFVVYDGPGEHHLAR
jgi:citrate synthase